MLIYHIASADGLGRGASGPARYTTSTRGRTLAEEGFIHASRADQWEETHRRFYAEVSEPLVLLTIDTDLLSVEVRQDPVGDDWFPHVYGPIDPAAVVDVRQLQD